MLLKFLLTSIVLTLIVVFAAQIANALKASIAQAIIGVGLIFFFTADVVLALLFVWNL